jgi:long-chain acyl-CoA synthetase
VRPHLATLVDDFRRHGDQIAVVTYTGNRRRTTSYADLARLAERFAAELERRNIGMGERVVLWGQNGAEWVGAFFGCVLRGVLAVPLDAAGSADFAQRVVAETRPLLVVGDSELLRQLAGPSATLEFSQFAALLPAAPAKSMAEPALNADTPLQILFTSGTTAEPKGIVHTHRNVLASLTPIEREMRKYLRYERIFHPLRFLHTLPLSHVFGQFMGLWVPPLLAAEVHYESRLQAPRLVELIRRNRVSVLAAVPRVLDLMKTHLEGEHPALARELAAAQGIPAWKRWWRFRRVHREFGLKFWAFVCGGASLPQELERFWRELGFVLIQGYGMTETAALITLNHPFHVGQGTIGKPLPGREIRISDDGEIQVKGDMVSTATWRGGAIEARSDPWLATGDLVAADDQGRLRFVGRKSEVIVTASGLNVHPEDLEAALRAQRGVRESVVVPLEARSGMEPAAALLLAEGGDAQSAVVAANAQLADFQQVRHWRVWPDLDFPRTSTGKIQRRKVAVWLAAQSSAASGAAAPGVGADSLLLLIASVSGVAPDAIHDASRLSEDLHLDSLARVQLQSELDQRWGIGIADEEFSQIATVGELRSKLGAHSDAAPAAAALTAESRQITATRTAAIPQPPSQLRYPRWPWTWPVHAARAIFIEAVMRPLVWLLAAPRVERAPTFRVPSQPVLIIANHVTAYDPALVEYALPGRMRRHVVAAMAADMLEDFRRGRNQGNAILNLLAPAAYWLITALFNVFPLPRNAGFRRSFAHAGEAMDQGFNVLVFPEGHRTLDGRLHAFRSGIGLLARESGASILPVALLGLGELKRAGRGWFRSGRLRVRVGELLVPRENESPEELTERLHAALGALLAEDDNDQSMGDASKQ